MKKTFLMMAATGVLGGPMTAYSVPVIYDFTGTGEVCAYTGTGVDSTCGGQSFTGTVTIDVLAAGPDGGDAFTDGSTFASDSDGSWVQSDFLIQWGSNSFNPGPVPNQYGSSQRGVVWNDNFGTDMLENEEQYIGGVSGGTYYRTRAHMTRRANTSWLTDLSFVHTGLAPGLGAFNHIWFDDISYIYEGTVVHYSGYFGSFDLASLTVRGGTSVPEPGTLALLGAGLAGVGLVRRRRAT